MIRLESVAEAAFRQDGHSWLEATLPWAIRGLTFRLRPDETTPWCRALAADALVDLLRSCRAAELVGLAGGEFTPALRNPRPVNWPRKTRKIMRKP